MENGKKQGVVYAFIDATNIIYGCGSAGWKLDFEKLAKYLKTRYRTDKIFYYAGVDDKNLKQLKFYERLAEFNYLLRLVPVKTFADGHKKADVDSRMTFDMMLHFEEYTDALIFTGDGDYYWVLEHLLSKKNSVRLFGTHASIARELRQLFKGCVLDLALLRKMLEYK